MEPTTRVLRPYQPSDFAACVRVFESTIPKFFLKPEQAGFERFLNEHGHKDYWVLCEEPTGKILGCGGIAVRDSGQGDLCFGLIDSQYHRQGLGALLTSFRLAKLVRDPATRYLALHTSQHTIGFYSKFGFQLVGVEENCYGPGLHRNDMRLELSSEPEKRMALAQEFSDLSDRLLQRKSPVRANTLERL